MCVIVVKSPKKKFSDEIVDQCWARNAQGAGFIFIPDKGDIIVEKGIMSLPAFKEKTSKFRDKSGTLVSHFRIQSRGGVSAELTHPFEFTNINSKTKRYFCHNGTVRAIIPFAGQSDSSTLAKLIENLSDTDALKIISKMNKNNFGRFVAVIGKKVHVYADDKSSSKDGLWFSNTEHEMFKKGSAAPTVGDGAYEDYSDYGGHHNVTRNYVKDYMNPMVPTNNSSVLLSCAERSEIIKNATLKAAIYNNVPEESREDWRDEVTKDWSLTVLPNADLLKIKNSTDPNPLLEFFIEKYI